MMVNGKEVAKNEDRAMNVVIVAASPKVSRTFYAKTYTEGEVTAPDCCLLMAKCQAQRLRTHNPSVAWTAHKMPRVQDKAIAVHAVIASV